MQQIFKYGTLPLAGQVGQFYVVEMIESRAKSQFGKNRGHFDKAFKWKNGKNTGTVMSNSRVNAISVSPWAQKSILQLAPKSFCTL